MDIRDSTFSLHPNAGVFARAQQGGTLKVAMAGSQVTANLNGILAISFDTATLAFTATGNLFANNNGDGVAVGGTGTTAVLGDNTISGNVGNGISGSQSTILSPGTNVVRLNGTDVLATITPFGKI